MDWPKHLLIIGGLSNNEAQERLKGTLAKDKNEILFSEFSINYNNEPDQFKKGSTLIKEKGSTIELCDDIIGDAFWNKYPHLLKKWGTSGNITLFTTAAKR